MPADSNISHINTRVVIIANWSFPNWDVKEQKHNIPNIESNMKQLRAVMENKVGIPTDNITLIDNKKASVILEELEVVTKSVKGKDSTLIVYYAGHGLPVSNKGLFWATYDTTMDDYDQPYISKSIATSAIKEFLSTSNAEKKILICDCCYAADMLKGTEGALGAFLEVNERKEKIKGTFYMFSSDSSEESWFPVDKKNEPTYFTQALLSTLTDGVNPNEPYCTIGNLFSTTVEKIKELGKNTQKNIPIPRKSENDNVEEYILFRNPGYKNQAEIELEQILADVNDTNLKKWMETYPNHPKWDIAFDALHLFNESMKELIAITKLPAEEQSDAYYKYTKKYKSNTILKGLGYTRYNEVNSTLEKASPVVMQNTNINTANDNARGATPQVKFENIRPADAAQNNVVTNPYYVPNQSASPGNAQ